MEYKALKDIAKITMGQSPDSSSYNEDGDGIPFFQGNADFGEVYPSERIWCNDPKKIAEPGDILISVRAPIGALNYAKDRCCIIIVKRHSQQRGEKNYEWCRVN